ncbi:MAG: glycosyltransferase, partial [Planctomycetaceae bacterium]
AGFAAIARQHSGWNLVIVGDGPARKELELQIAGHGLADRILLTGWIEHPWTLLQKASVFVLPSRYEGFPNALLEAMARGKACIATDCQSGPAEIIQSGINGLLVDADHSGDVQTALEAALDNLLSNQDLRESLGEHATDVRSEFGAKKYFRAWDDIDV